MPNRQAGEKIHRATMHNENDHRYNVSDKGRARNRRYEVTTKAHERQQRYRARPDVREHYTGLRRSLRLIERIRSKAW